MVGKGEKSVLVVSVPAPVVSVAPSKSAVEMGSVGTCVVIPPPVFASLFRFCRFVGASSCRTGSLLAFFFLLLVHERQCPLSPASLPHFGKAQAA